MTLLASRVHVSLPDPVGLPREHVLITAPAIRGQRVWVCGLAIAPAFRSKGVGSLLLGEYLNLLRERPEVRLVQLEVIKENVRAHKLYQRFGFISNFELLDYEIEDVKALPDPTGLTVSTSDRLDLSLPWLQHRVDYSWQREFSSLLGSCRGLKQVVIKREEGELLAALAIEAAEEPFRITGFAYQRNGLSSEQLASAIRAGVGDASKGVKIRLEPDISDVIPLLEGIDGCKRDPSYEEYNMVLSLESKSEQTAGVERT